MVDATPLAWPTGWPRAKSRKSAKFSASSYVSYATPGTGGYNRKRDLSISEATDRVVKELSSLGVGHGQYVISTNLELRNDGLPRSGQRMPADPGVAVYWTRRGQTQKVMAIDIYDKVADNLAAVAATLNAMRAIERHGGAQILERAFTGFAAIAAPVHWWDVLEVNANATEDQIKAAYRRLAAKYHPDNQDSGSEIRMSELNVARDAALKELGNA